MINETYPMITRHLNATVYVDYENIFELLKKYGKNPLDINFFSVMLSTLKEKYKLNVIDFIVYNNFEKKSSDSRLQTILRSSGMQTRHSSTNGKNSSDLELTVDALRTLYKNPSIDVFVIISSDRDIIPLIKAIKYENKLTYVFSTKNGFNPVVIEYADQHEYIEDIFNLKEEPVLTEKDREIIFDFHRISATEIQRAKEVSKLFYSSNVWKRNENKGEAISLSGYVNIISKTVNRLSSEIVDDFKRAHYLKFVTIYRDPKKGLCIKQGERRHELEDSV